MLPTVTSKVAKYSKAVTSFSGVDFTPRSPSNALKDALNITGDYFPFLSSRKKRYIEKEIQGEVDCMDYRDGLIYITRHEGKKYLVTPDNTVEIENPSKEKSFFAQLSHTILIMPEKLIYNIEDKTLTAVQKSVYSDIYTAPEKYKEQTNGDIHAFDTSNIGYITYSGIHARKEGDFYYADFTLDFKPGDILNIKMDVEPEPKDYTPLYFEIQEKYAKGIDLKLKSIEKVTHKVKNGTVTECVSLIFEDNTFSLEGYEEIYFDSITITRRVPDLVDLRSCNNRLWGVTKDGVETSMLGNGAQWYDYTSDTYGTLPSSCFSWENNTDSDFTAIYPFGGNILAFKENCIHKIYGDQPENYTIVTVECPGVAQGCRQTLVTLGGNLYYKGINGIYEYNAGQPVKISASLGELPYKALFSGSDGVCYCIAMEYGGEIKLYRYNPVYKTWHIESLSQNCSLVWGHGQSLYIAENERIYSTFSQESGTEKTVPWHFKLEFDEKSLSRKNYLKLKLNYSLATDGYFYVYVYFDGEKIKKYAFSDFTSDNNDYAFIPLPQKPCRKLTVSFEGNGDFQLKSLSREFILLNEGGK